MSLHDRWLQALSSTIPHIEALVLQTEAIRGQMHELTFTAATALRDFREAYGYKFTPPYIFQQATVASFILLRSLDSSYDQTRAQETSPERHGDRPITDIVIAFEECVRCLLACGVQIMLPRGIARMMYHTAIQLKMEFPKTVEQMLHIIGETLWQTSDLERFNSAYPNLVLASKRNATAEDYEMEKVLRRSEDLRSFDDQLEL